MTHSLTTNAAMGHFHSTPVTDHPLVFHAPVFATGAFPVFFRAKYFFAHKPILFGTVRTIVNRLRFLHLTERPATDVVRSGQTDFYG